MNALVCNIENVELGSSFVLPNGQTCFMSKFGPARVAADGKVVNVKIKAGTKVRVSTSKIGLGYAGMKPAELPPFESLESRVRTTLLALR